jgi:CHASE3 domain sensor protein
MINFICGLGLPGILLIGMMIASYVGIIRSSISIIHINSELKDIRNEIKLLKEEEA